MDDALAGLDDDRPKWKRSLVSMNIYSIGWSSVSPVILYTVSVRDGVIVSAVREYRSRLITVEMDQTWLN